MRSAKMSLKSININSMPMQGAWNHFDAQIRTCTAVKENAVRIFMHMQCMCVCVCVCVCVCARVCVCVYV